MLRIVLNCTTLEQVETVLLATKALGIRPEVGVGPEPVPQRKFKARRKSTKKRVNAFAKGRASVRLSPGTHELSPRMEDCQKALRAEFGGDSFQRSLARGVIARRAKIKNPSGYVTQLVRQGVLIRA